VVEANPKEETKMRVTAGILTIIGGFIGSSLLLEILHELHIYGMLIYLPLILAGVGGAMALRRVHYKWALAGAICSLLFPFFGIPAIILLVKSKGDFFPYEAAIQDNERHECLTYYEEEKKLYLLCEKVARLFDKRLGKYEDEYFKARKSWRKYGIDDNHPDPMDVMDKIFEVHEYFSQATTEIVKRKKQMRLAPSPASAMSSAYEAAYLDYEATKDPSNIAAGSNSMEVQAREVRQKELGKKSDKSIYKAWQEEKEFRKRLKLSSSEYQKIVDNVARAVATDEWLRKLEVECP
jgi:hypothetical protein